MSYRTGDYVIIPVRTAAILTTSYVTANINDTESDGSTLIKDCSSAYNQLILYIGFTIGSLTSGQVKIEFSADNSNWYQETFASVSTTTSTEVAGEHSYAATGNFRILIPICDKYIRISAKGTGTVTSSSMTINAILGRV